MTHDDAQPGGEAPGREHAADRSLVLESASEADTAAIAARIARILAPGDIVALDGELGAGKTRFAKGVAHALGHRADDVVSPTYVVAHEHHTPGVPLTIIHADAYRLDHDADPDRLAADLGIDSLDEHGAALIIEWSARAPALRDAATVTVLIEHVGVTARRITIAATRPDRLSEFSPSQRDDP